MLVSSYEGREKCDLRPDVRAFLYKAYLLEASSLYTLELQVP